MRFVLRADREGLRFRFAPLGGETFSALVPEPERASLPDSLLVRTEDGRWLSRSAAVIHLLKRLGRWWRAIGVLAAVVPRPFRDWTYDRIARIRHRLFARPDDACPVASPEQRARFDP